MHANNKGAGMSSYQSSLISAFVVHLLESVIIKLAHAKFHFKLVYAAKQTGLSLTQ